MKEPKYHWQYGILSGYAPCCILWFYIRTYLYIYPGFYRWRLFRKLNSYFAKSKFGHVTCPAHEVLHALGKYPAKYFTCPECGWHQYGNSKRCAVKDGHKGWVFRRIDDYYASVRSNYVYIRLAGRIAVQARKKYGIK